MSTGLSLELFDAFLEVLDEQSVPVFIERPGHAIREGKMSRGTGGPWKFLTGENRLRLLSYLTIKADTESKIWNIYGFVKGYFKSLACPLHAAPASQSLEDCLKHIHVRIASSVSLYQLLTEGTAAQLKIALMPAAATASTTNATAPTTNATASITAVTEAAPLDIKAVKEALEKENQAALVQLYDLLECKALAADTKRRLKRIAELKVELALSC